MSKGTPHVSITTGKSKRESSGSASAHDSAGSEASGTVRTGFPHVSPPFPNSGHGSLRPQAGHHRNPSSDESILSSNRTSQVYHNSSDYDTPSLATGTTASSSSTRPVIHHAPRGAMPAQINTTLGQANGPAGLYHTKEYAPIEVYTETTARTERSQRPTSSYGAAEKTERVEARRRHEASAPQAQEETAKHVRFSEKDRGKLRAEERAQNSYALYEKQRAEERERLREQDRRDREAQAAKDEAKKRTKQVPAAKPTRRASVSKGASQAAEKQRLAAFEAAEQQRLVAADEAHMQHERLRTEAIERDEQMAQQYQQRPAYQERVPSFHERSQDPRLYDQRATNAAPGIARRGSYSSSKRGEAPQARESRQQRQPPVSYYNAAPRGELPQAREPRRPSFSQPSAPTDPWDVRSVGQALPDARSTQPLPNARGPGVGHNFPRLQPGFANSQQASHRLQNAMYTGPYESDSEDDLYEDPHRR